MSEIVIRHALKEDAEALHQIFCQPDVYADTLRIPHASLRLWQDSLSTQREGLQILVACVGDDIAGEITVEVNSRLRRRHTATFGIVVSTHYRGRGVAKAMMHSLIDLCDNWLSVDRIELTVFADNLVAIGLYEQFGFTTEGRAHRYAMRNGKQVDAFYMARFRP